VILVVAEQSEGRLHRASWEALAAAQQLAGREPVQVVVLGSAPDDAALQLAEAGVGDVIIAANPALERYTADAYITVLASIVTGMRPRFVVLPHTYQARDFAPALAARLDRPLVTDVAGIRGAGPSATFMRPIFQGKLAAEVAPQGGDPCFITIQIGAFRADAVQRGVPRAVTSLDVAIDPTALRQQAEPPFQEARQRVDLSQASRIVAVGRGIKGQEHVAVGEALARVLGAELAASRPVCDSGWLAMDRQVGSSGQTVAPKLYVAVGISGAIQHVVGMKGAATIVAINKDAEAPIFEIADFGIVGDLFEVVPAIVKEVEQLT
jgi:electron transfer flavoprotein alpha subunit